MHEPRRTPDWAAVRRAVEAGDMTRAAICRGFGVTRGELARRIKTSKWNAPEHDDAQDQRLLLQGLLWALERQIDQMGRVDLTDAVKEAAVLQRLASTLEDLVRLGDKGGAAPGTTRQSKEMAELRGKIARRIDELNLQ